MSFKIVKFSDLFSYENKSSIKAGDGLSEGSYPFFTSSTIQSKYLNEYSFSNDSLIFGTGGNASIHYCESPFSVSTDCIVAVAKDKSMCDSKYVFYYLFGNIHILAEGFKGAGLKHISKSYIQELEIPLPPLSIQKRIAEILDAADALKRKDQQLLKKYDELAQAIFIDMFGDPVKNEKGWKITSIESVINKSRPITYGILMPGKDVKPNGIPYVRVLDIKDQQVLTNQVCHTSVDISNQYKRSILKHGDILYSIRGHVGRSSLVPSALEGANITQDTARLDFNNEISNVFAFGYFNTIQFNRLVRPLVRGAAVKGLNLGDLRDLPIPIPSIKLQSEYEKRIKLIWDQKNNSSIICENSKALFNSLIQKAFNGELVS